MNIHNSLQRNLSLLLSFSLDFLHKSGKQNKELPIQRVKKRLFLAAALGKDLISN